ncbi:transmembrane protein 238 [Tachyglossus aculeatus]|uniref:transmembrane protein 238 n=1 Tax=Tachyglossus aculeatus TaxID=9261 RepID=UPI0018F682CE|nr:transmembrane protein 238 [Tachyglossus aculeatus]
MASSGPQPPAPSGPGTGLSSPVTAPASSVTPRAASSSVTPRAASSSVAPRAASSSVAPRAASSSVTLPQASSSSSVTPPQASSGLGRCRAALVLAVALDVAGMAALLTGVFARLQAHGRDFGDLLIYSGALLVFLSLLGWIFWYTGNIEISRLELQRDYGLRPGTLARLARKLSRRWSQQATTGVGASARHKGGPPPGCRVRLQLGDMKGEAAGAAATALQ